MLFTTLSNFFYEVDNSDDDYDGYDNDDGSYDDDGLDEYDD